jgi:uncharacterized membrane protein
MPPLPVITLALEQSAPAASTVFLACAILVGCGCIVLILAFAMKAIDDWYASGAEQREKNRRTDRQAAQHLRQRRRAF